MRRLPRRSSCLRGLLLCSAGCILMSSSLPAAKKVKQSDVTEVVVIEVPVQVTYGGEPARGLTPDQFELFDGRKRRELTGFDVYDLSGATLEETPLGLRIPAAAQRKFLFFFDLSLSLPEAVIRARDAARELVETGLGPTDLVGVATWSIASGLDLVLGFSSDRRQAGMAIESLGLNEPNELRRDPLGIAFSHGHLHWGHTPDPGVMVLPERSSLEVRPGRLSRQHRPQHLRVVSRQWLGPRILRRGWHLVGVGQRHL